MNFLNNNFENDNFAFTEKRIISVNFLDGLDSENKNKIMGSKIKETKQKIVAIVIILFMFLMVATSLEIKQVMAENNQTNLLQNITTGTLTITAFPNVGFNDVAAGTGVNSLANLAVINVRDYRGTGDGWDASAVCTNFMNGAGGTVQISNVNLKISLGDLFAYNGASNTGVAKGAGGTFDSAQVILNTDGTSGEGAYNLYNNTLNLTISTSDQALDYNALMTFSIT